MKADPFRRVRMRARARLFSACAAVGGLFGLLAHNTAALSAEGDRIQGVWQGQYICSQGPTGLTLTIEGSDPSRLTARFKFYAVPENPRVPTGELEMTGRFDSRIGRFQFRPKRWIKRPSGYATVGLSGLIDSSGKKLTGRLPASGCQTFTLSRSSVSVARQPSPTPIRRRHVPKSLREARTLHDKCEVLLAWLDRIKSEYPDVDFYRTSTTKLYPKILNLYRDEFFVPVFGRPFDKTLEDWRSAFFHDVIRPCARSREGRPSYRDRFHDYYTIFFRPFSLPRGSFSYQEVAAKLDGVRLTLQVRKRVLDAIETLEPSDANLQAIDSYLEQGRKDFAGLWPSEQKQFERRLTQRKQAIAQALVDVALKNTKGLDDSLESARHVSNALSRVERYAATLEPDVRVRLKEELGHRLDTMLGRLIGRDLAALRAIDGGSADSGKLTAWFKDFEQEYKPYAERKPYQGAVTTYRQARNAMFAGSINQYRDKLKALASDRFGIKAAAAMLEDTFELKNDKALPAYAKYKRLTLDRIAQIQTALDSKNTPAANDPRAPGGAASSSPPAVPSATPVHRCDELASHPADPSKPAAVPGVADDKVKAEEAIEACIEAVRANPDEPRFAFELGRALVLAHMADDAKDFFQSAADRGYATAFAYLGDYEDDQAKTRALYARAARAGFAPARRYLEEGQKQHSSAEFPLDRYQVPGLMRAIYAGDMATIPDDRDTRGIVVSIFKRLNEYCGEASTDVGFAAIEYSSEQAAKVMNDPTGRAGAEVVAKNLMNLFRNLQRRGAAGIENYVREKAILRSEGLHDGKLLVEKFGCSDVQVQRFRANLHRLIKARRKMRPDPTDAGRLTLLLSDDYKKIHGIKNRAGGKSPAKRLKDACVNDYMKNASASAPEKETFCRCLATGAVRARVQQDDMTLLAANFTTTSLNELKKKRPEFRKSTAGCYR